MEHPMSRGAVLVCSLLLTLSFAPLARGEELSRESLTNWPQWRGPWLNGASPTADPPQEWSESKNIKWKVEIPGAGSSTPAVWGDRIFILTAAPSDKPAEE